MSNYPSLVDKLYELKSNLPNDVFLRQPYGDRWEEFTYDEVITEALQFVTAMKSIGLKKGEAYYQNAYVLANSVNIGITDNISLGGGILRSQTYL